MQKGPYYSFWWQYFCKTHGIRRLEEATSLMPNHTQKRHSDVELRPSITVCRTRSKCWTNASQHPFDESKSYVLITTLRWSTTLLPIARNICHYDLALEYLNIFHRKGLKGYACVTTLQNYWLILEKLQRTQTKHRKNVKSWNGLLLGASFLETELATES